MTERGIRWLLDHHPIVPVHATRAFKTSPVKDAIDAAILACRRGKNGSEPSCKPGPVSPPVSGSGGGGHSSRPRVAAGLERAYPGARRATAAARGGAPLFALAPGGACRAIDVAADAVRSYRTVSPLPASQRAVCSLWRCPASRLGWPLTSTLPCGARTFLPRIVSAGVRPDGSDPAGTVAHEPPSRHSIRSSMARFDISSASPFSSRGTWRRSTRPKERKSAFAFACSTLRAAFLTW